MIATNNMLTAAAALLATTLFGTVGAVENRGSPMPNVNFPDPTVIHAEEKWWAFATPENAKLPHIPMAVSDDYKTWRMVKNADGSLWDALPKLPKWVRNADKDDKPHALWAPHISKLDDGSYLLYYAAGLQGTVSTHCISAAKSNTIKGPYKAIGDKIITCPKNSQGAFDISEFKDWKYKGDWGLPTVQGGKTSVRRENCPQKVDGKCGNSWFDAKWSEGGYGGKRYIVYKHQSADRTTKTPLTLHEVKADGITTVGKPVVLLDWKEGDFGSIEAPSIYKTPAGKYVLMYSKGNTAMAHYTASYAVADNVKGPYVRKGDLLKTGVFGLNAPGGGEITWNGERMVFHEMMQPIGKPYEGKRKMHAANIEVDDKTGKITFESV